ncbi:hypothetical protein [Neobacillus vireti]|uniref:Lipoprotein n=1 Tax=Neobacillus vireti LMG 21834 TaxID=1131730 RepID=A0AB94IMK7_9BACI|nr:hypothetical protein [Neobacillus vireti]ETI68249.1 hypothetical protein BAVI_13344 [Neobacillus vireti LMG 21834]KLT17734.1 hypothetical protein AA980_11535 [Neobacillus vireti]
MFKTILLFSLTIFSLSILVSCSVTKIVDGNYEIVSLYIIKNDKAEKVAQLKDKKKIQELTNLINSSKKEDADSVVFEKGPDGILVFEKKDKKLELQVFTNDGNLLTKEYYVNSAIDMKKYFGY